MELRSSATVLAAFGQGELAVGMMLHQAFRADRRSTADADASAMGAAMQARARAEADAPPTEADGAVVHVASGTLAVGTDAVWPLVAHQKRYDQWMPGLQSATAVEGTGSSRVQELTWTNGHRVRQRVTRFSPEREIAWRDVEEWLQDLPVPAWHEGSWMQVLLDRTADGGCTVQLVATLMPGDDDQRARIVERAPALQAWLDSSLAYLAQAAGG
jgi:uncharacterized protein YndB with AHSA1/START domain